MRLLRILLDFDSALDWEDPDDSLAADYQPPGDRPDGWELHPGSAAAA